MALKPEVPIAWGENQRRWHLDKTISISHIVSLLLIGASVWAGINSIEKKADANKQEIEHVRETMNEREARAEQLRREMKADFIRVHEKLDRIISGQ